MKKLIIIILLSLILTNTAIAATIRGVVYDFSLDKVKNVIIEINTNPIQRQISQDGSYNFNAPVGSYTITAKNQYNETLTTEDIEIKDDGNYNLDLITSVDLDEELLDSDINLDEDINLIEDKNNTWIVIIIIIILLILIIVFIKSRKGENKIEETDLANKVLEIIKKNDGRITQKELRKLLPYSEAKISLIITELESKGKIQKIKKGRSNVLILKK